jgi:acyl-CoA synthetase (AMP-forming)/AMP-acid ligase II
VPVADTLSWPGGTAPRNPPPSWSSYHGPPVRSGHPCLEEIIRPWAVTSRDVAFTDTDGRVRVSYLELAHRMAIAADRLRRRGVGPGALVAMTLANDLPSVLSALATWACGATVVSLPPFPRRAAGWYSRQFGQVLDQLGAGFLIEGPHQAAELSGWPGLGRVPAAALAEPQAERVADSETAAPATALIQFTSGSVGAPKGVAISSAVLAGHLATLIAAFEVDGEADRLVSWLPLYHDLGFIVMFLTGLAARADQVLTPPSTFAKGPATWLTMLHQERGTVTAAPDFAYRLAAAVPYPERLDLSRVRMSISGGERLSWQTLLDFQATAEPMGMRWEAITPAYGLAEATVGVSNAPPGRGPVRGPGGHVSVGRLMRGVELRVPAGSAPGPIQLRGPWLFDGYHTADNFEPAAAGTWFDTGDAGFVHEDELYVLGRRDEVLTLAGRNVFAEDVESVAHDACGQRVRVCAAFRTGTAAGRFGLVAEADPRLVADRDEARELAHLIQTSVIDALRTRVAPVLIVSRGVIPRTTSGKVQRAQCRSLIASGEADSRILAELT